MVGMGNGEDARQCVCCIVACLGFQLQKGEETQFGHRNKYESIPVLIHIVYSMIRFLGIGDPFLG